MLLVCSTPEETTQSMYLGDEGGGMKLSFDRNSSNDKTRTDTQTQTRRFA